MKNKQHEDVVSHRQEVPQGQNFINRRFQSTDIKDYTLHPSPAGTTLSSVKSIVLAGLESRTGCLYP